MVIARPFPVTRLEFTFTGGRVCNFRDTGCIRIITNLNQKGAYEASRWKYLHTTEQLYEASRWKYLHTTEQLYEARRWKHLHT